MYVTTVCICICAVTAAINIYLISFDLIRRNSDVGDDGSILRKTLYCT